MAHLRQLSVVQEWRRRIRPHAAGVPALVAIQRPFVVLGSRKESEPRSVTECMKRNLGSLQKFLNDNARTGGAECFANHDFVNGLFSGSYAGGE